MRKGRARRPTPQIAAKKAEAARVLQEISAIDEQLNATSEQYDGARVRLQALRKNLKSEQAQLGAAKARYQLAQQRAAKFVVWLYTSPHASSLDVILGARNLGDMLRALRRRARDQPPGDGDHEPGGGRQGIARAEGAAA